MELQKQTWAMEAVSLQDTPNILESIPVTDYVTTSMCPVEIKPTNGNLNRDTFDDSVILQFDPGDTKEKLLDDRSDAWHGGEAEASPRDPLISRVIQIYDPGGRNHHRMLPSIRHVIPRLTYYRMVYRLT